MNSQNPKPETRNLKSPAVFLDRDGTLVEEVNFLSRLEDLRVFDYASAALRLLRESGFRIFVVTNQSGIGREIFTEEAMHAIHAQMQIDLGNQIEAFYFCPHLPSDGCRCRKPSLGMIEAASADFSIDPANSWMIGDKLIDIETGFNAKMRTALVLTGYGQKTRVELTRQPDIIAENLLAAARIILENET